MRLSLCSVVGTVAKFFFRGQSLRLLRLYMVESHLHCPTLEVMPNVFDLEESRSSKNCDGSF